MRSASDLLELLVQHVFIVLLVDLIDITIVLRLFHIFDFELVFSGQLQQFRFPLFKPERSGNLIVDVKLHSLENDVTLLVDDVAKAIYEVATPVDSAVTFVHEFTIGASDNYEITQVVNFKFSHDVGQFKVRDGLLFHRLDLLFA